MEKILNITYASSLTDIRSLNSSFDIGVLKICYTGDNRNGSNISKEAITKSLDTIYNCPVVANYDRETDTIGGHDIEFVSDDDEGYRIVNITQPVGVVPECAKPWFEKCEDENGKVHEYLCSEVLLWKRQEAYSKIKKDGIVKHSMEITVLGGHDSDGIFCIDEFEFNAFCLLGNCEPCFEGSSLRLFGDISEEIRASLSAQLKEEFSAKVTEMLRDMTDGINTITAFYAASAISEKHEEVDDIQNNTNSVEGGERGLENKMRLLADYGVEIESLDFSIEDITEEELEAKLKELSAKKDYALTGNMVEELERVLSDEKVKCDWGERNRYYYIDCDLEAGEVYCYDTSDWLIYGFGFTVSGDSVTVDYACKKRKKYAIVDFDEGEQPSPFSEIFALMEQKIREGSEWEEKYQAAQGELTSLNDEVAELRTFKAEADAAAGKLERDTILSQFEDLAGIEAFEALRTNAAEYDTEVLEEKCYAIRGRNGVPAKFSENHSTPKIIIERSKTDNNQNEPYGGIFVKYGLNSTEE